MNAISFKMTGYLDAAGNVAHVQASSETSTYAEAQAIALALPKSCGVKASRYNTAGNADAGILHLYAVTQANGVNGGRNEAGIKKVRKLMSVANVEIVKGEAGNAATPEQILAAI